MKRLSLLLFLAPSAFGQWMVFDPANHVVNLAIESAQHANHLEVLRQWAQQIERLNQQLRQLEQQLAEQRRIRQVLGDPTAAGARLILENLGADELARQYGQNLEAIQRIANAIASLRRTAQGIYRELDDKTVLNRPFTRQTVAYRRFAAVDAQADQVGQVYGQTGIRMERLQRDLATTLTSLKSATTQAEVDKLNGQIAALNGQLAVLATQRRDESDKLQALQIQNENQAAKEQQDLLEKQIADERQTLGAVDAWQQSVRITPDSYSRR